MSGPTRTEPLLEYVMPCTEAMLAGTLALMTAHAQCRCPVQRGRIVCRVQAQLGWLSEHPGLSGACRQLAQQLQTAWAAPQATLH